MKRKLIKQAGQAVTITLPIDWIRSNNLKPGDEIDLEINKKDLILRSYKKTVTGRTKMDTTGFPMRMKYLYNNAGYARGVDQIDLVSDKGYYPDLSQSIGFAVVKQKGQQFTIRDVSGVSSEDLDEIFKRVFQMLIGFLDSAIEDIFGPNKEDMDVLKNIDGEINKFALFLQRSIMKSSHPEKEMGKIMFAASFQLEKIGDEILRLWRASVKYQVSKDKKIKDVVILSRKGLESAFKIYYQSDVKNVEQLLRIKKSIRKKAFDLYSIDSDTANFLFHAVRIVEESSDFIHLALMKKMKIF